ncbi:MAG TPA: Asp-tRNA(Asn)/Glu-tRNA(Gln) amidotransferase subunit GatC [Pseudomonadales bacterium]|nr:Asp-tRNA(Asn)/Glu-tRNA(Gln) amidotransferase subunit GatC [Pseudomonadales bacterium]
MAIDKHEIEKLSRLARLSVSEDDSADVAERITRILDLVDQLQAVDTHGVAPMSHPLDAVQRLRADEVSETNQREAFQAIAPNAEQGLYLVPKVIE